MSDPHAASLRLHVRRVALAQGPSVGVSVALRVPGDLRCVEEAVELMALHCFAGQTPTRRTRFRLRVVLAEAITNAIVFGAAEDPSRAVLVAATLTESAIHLQVSDEGPGFDPERIPDPVEPEALERPAGRGLFLIRNLADSVAFNPEGNTIWMTLPRS